MSLVRWKPSYDLPFPSGLLDVQREINRMFDSIFREGSPQGDSLATAAWMPPVDIEELDRQFTVQVELPGVVKDDVKIVMQDNILTIRGEKKQEKQSKSATYQRVERLYGSFQRSFSLPVAVRNDAIEATFKDGILTVTVPKAEEARAKQIEVKVR
jgi:HSP20 family protein